MKKKVAIVGSGFFGITAALILSRKFDIDLYEKKKSILNGASKANQMRFHQGYHYPRSIKTLNEVKKFNKSFLEFYGKDILGKTNNYYAISKKNSKTSYHQFVKFLNKNKLYYKNYQNDNFSNLVSKSILGSITVYIKSLIIPTTSPNNVKMKSVPNMTG